MKNYKYIEIDKFLSDNITVEDIPIDVGDFPLEVFPEQLRLFFNSVGKTMNFHKDILAISYLSLISTIVGNKYKLKVRNGWLASSTLWLCIVGNSGVAKSPPIKFIWKPLRDKIDKKEYDRYILEKQRFDDNLELKKNERQDIPKPVFCQNVLTDTTLEGLYYAWNMNKTGMCMYREELKGWLLSMNSYRKGSDEQTWLELNDNTTTTINRATKDTLYIEDPCINVLGAIQPSILNEFNSDNGMFQRILFSNEIKEVNSLSRLELDEKIIDWYNNHVIGIYSAIRSLEPEIINMGEGFDVFVKYDEEYLTPMIKSENTSETMKGTLSKMKTFIPRISLLLCVIDSVFGETKEYSSIHVEKAIKVADYFIKSNKYLTEMNEKNKDMENITKTKGKSRAETILELTKKGHKQTDIAKYLKISRQTVINELKKNKNEESNK